MVRHLLFTYKLLKTTEYRRYIFGLKDALYVGTMETKLSRNENTNETQFCHNRKCKFG